MCPNLAEHPENEKGNERGFNEMLLIVRRLL